MTRLSTRGRSIVALAGLLVIALLLCIFTVPTSARADTSVRYGVRPIYPENQRSDRDGHFNLRVTPGMVQVVEVEVQNLGDRVAVVEISANAAYTNENGVMEYIPLPDQAAPAQASRAAHQPSFAEMVTANESLLEVAPGTSGIATFTIRVPESAFEGVLLGGFHFVEAIAHQSGESRARGETDAHTGVVNRMAYAIPVVLREEDDVPPPAFALQGVARDASYTDALRITLRNTAGRIAHLEQFAAILYAQGGDAPLETLTLPMIQMTPYAEPNLRVWRDTRAPLPAGHYRLQVSFVCEDTLYVLEEIFALV